MYYNSYRQSKFITRDYTIRGLGFRVGIEWDVAIKKLE